MRLRLHTDGASRGNPGPAGIGAVLERADDGAVMAEVAEYLGRATNNVAEYRALAAGLRRALDLGAEAVEVCSDSELMVRQLQGAYRVRSAALAPLLHEARRLLTRFPGGFRISHVPRGQNRRADELANHAIDAGIASRTGGAPAQGTGTSGAASPSAGTGEAPRQPILPDATAATVEPDAANEAATPGNNDAASGAARVWDLATAAEGLAVGESVGLGLGAGVHRLAPGRVLGTSAPTWVVVLEGAAELRGASVARGQCCRLDPRDLLQAGDLGAVVLAIESGLGG